MSISFHKDIDRLAQQGLQRVLRSQEGPQGRMIVIDGKKVLNFCSNNYLGLAGDIRLCAAAQQAMASQGFGSGASRLICGNMTAHQQLEQALADFKGTEACLLFSTGYMANVGIISSVFGRQDVIFSDKLNHASIIDGILLSRATFKRYAHRDMNALERLLRSCGGYRKRGIITDSVFSMDGDIAPLDEIVALAKKYDCLVMIDEAHALGVMGRQGRGAAEHFGLEKDIDIQMGTLSKAAGSFGAYCCGSRALIEKLIHTARSFIYTTALPPSVAAASRKAIEIIQQEPDLRQQLWAKADDVRGALRQMGYYTMDSQTPIIPVMVGDSQKAVIFSQHLLAEGLFISAIRPPTVPPRTARLRLTIMASHTPEDIRFLLEKFQVIGKQLCLI